MSNTPDRHPARDLPEQLSVTWAQLRLAVADAKHEWHLPVVSTIGLDGSPEARTVVLRAADEANRELVFNTDRRSLKPREIERSSRIAWTFYERGHRVQLRMSGPATIHADDAIADEAWSRTSLSSRRCYLAPHAPSSTLEAWDPNLPQDLLASIPDQTTSEGGRSNFMVVRSRIDRLDRLELHHDGHLRGRWRWAGDELVETAWLAP